MSDLNTLGEIETGVYSTRLIYKALRHPLKNVALDRSYSFRALMLSPIQSPSVQQPIRTSSSKELKLIYPPGCWTA